MIKVDRASIGVSGNMIGAPRIWSKPVILGTDDYGFACDALIAEARNTIKKLEAVVTRFENSKQMFELTGVIPDEI